MATESGGSIKAVGKVRAIEHMLPSTFEERGAAIPFTTPQLAHARVRGDWRGRLELVVAKFAESAGAYVIPWPAVKDIGTLTTHDVMLHEEVMKQNALDPHGVRLCALTVAKTGLAGPEIAEAAEKALAEDEEAKALNQVVLILRVIEEAEPAVAKTLVRELATPQGQDRIRETLSSVAGRLGIEADILDKRISALGDKTYDVGTAWSPSEGRLRRQLKKLEAMQKSTAEWASERLGEAAEQAKFTSDVAAYTIANAREVLQKFDKMLASPRAIVADWDIKAPAAEKLARRLTWLIDGWDPIVEMWMASTEEAQHIDALSRIASVLPFVPRDEAESGNVNSSVFNTLQAQGRKWVRSNTNWQTGEPDVELIKRLEEVKAKTT